MTHLRLTSGTAAAGSTRGWTYFAVNAADAAAARAAVAAWIVANASVVGTNTADSTFAHPLGTGIPGIDGSAQTPWASVIVEAANPAAAAAAAIAARAADVPTGVSLTTTKVAEVA